MHISDVRIKLVNEQLGSVTNERMLAFVAMVIDGAIVVKDMKLIRNSKGFLVCMPSRKITDRCPKSDCRAKNPVTSRYCATCGAKLAENRAAIDETGRYKIYADVCHAINSPGRELIQRAVISAYQRELDLAKQPAYACTFDQYD